VDGSSNEIYSFPLEKILNPNFTRLNALKISKNDTILFQTISGHVRINNIDCYFVSEKYSKNDYSFPFIGLELRILEPSFFAYSVVHSHIPSNDFEVKVLSKIHFDSSSEVFQILDAYLQQSIISHTQKDQLKPTEIFKEYNNSELFKTYLQYLKSQDQDYPPPINNPVITKQPKSFRA